jgi:hypothetical protein
MNKATPVHPPIGLLLVMLGLSSGCGVAPQADWPADVLAFIAQREACGQNWGWNCCRAPPSNKGWN